jgi:hypothetical protein
MWNFGVIARIKKARRIRGNRAIRTLDLIALNQIKTWTGRDWKWKTKNKT